MRRIQLSILFALLLTVSAQTKPVLRFRPTDSDDGALFTVKIMQVADLHYGEGESTDWGPQQDVNSTRVLNTVIPLENPDLVVYTGDQLTGNNINANATNYWSELVQPCVDNDTPWAMVFGNHDDAPLDPPSMARLSQSGLKNIDSRYQLLEFDRKFPLSLSQQGPQELFGVTNYYLPVLGPNEGDSKTPLAILYMLDSGGGTLNESVTPGQVSWYLNTSISLQERFGLPTPIPALLFVHIPMEEYRTAWTPQCGGLNDDGVSPVLTSSGLLDAIVARGDIRAVFVGHDHGNTWCCPVKGVSLCYGRHSGYGGYGDWDRGTRIIELSLTPNPPEAQDAQVPLFGDWTWTTWVRMENGTVLHQ